jgi:opacity protein-like surface antigen
MKKFLIVIAMMVCMATYAQANDYNTAIGVRGGLYNGLTIKHFMKSNVAVEGIITTRWQGYNVTGLYEIHAPAFDTRRLKWYYGIGGHIGFWDGNDVHWGKKDENYTVIGVDGILGLEYSFKEIPFNVSLDWKPAFDLIGYSHFWGDGGAFSVRFMF